MGFCNFITSCDEKTGPLLDARSRKGNANVAEIPPLVTSEGRRDKYHAVVVNNNIFDNVFEKGINYSSRSLTERNTLCSW